MKGAVMTDLPPECQVEIWPPRIGVGGQTVGITTGVKITHIPTGTEAFCNVGRSQHVNRMIAADMMISALTHPRFN